MDTVTQILRERLPLGDAWWLKRKHLRRGNLTDEYLTLSGQGKTIKADWWQGHSGAFVCNSCRHMWEPDTLTNLFCQCCASLRVDTDDWVAHEECRPNIDGGLRFLREHRCELLMHHWEVEGQGYVGHPDWLMRVDNIVYLIDVKCGEPPTKDSPMDYYERYQLALYYLPLLCRADSVPVMPPRRANLHVFDGQYRFPERKERSDITEALAIVQFHHIMKKIGE